MIQQKEWLCFLLSAFSGCVLSAPPFSCRSCCWTPTVSQARNKNRFLVHSFRSRDSFALSVFSPPNSATVVCQKIYYSTVLTVTLRGEASWSYSTEVTVNENSTYQKSLHDRGHNVIAFKSYVNCNNIRRDLTVLWCLTGWILLFWK